MSQRLPLSQRAKAPAANLDDAYVLRHRFVLEYQNGEVPSWYGAHPLALSCQKVQAFLAVPPAAPPPPLP